MSSSAHDTVAIVGVGALLPDAPDAPTFWRNLASGRYSVSEVPPDRWDPAFYYDPDPSAPDKTYSKIGGWVRTWDWNPLAWKLPIPPRVSALMDRTQQWAVIAAREALENYGYPKRPLNPERTAVILGNAMGGDAHLYSAARILYPEYADALARGGTFQTLPASARTALLEEMRTGIQARTPVVNEDTMPGELSNIAAGRIAALYDFRGPNYVTDAACASTMAAMDAAIDGLLEGQYDAVLSGGVDANMAATSFVKFCKIGALSATGTRPYADGADGFIMGEGSALFLLKRLADAERDGDHIYALIIGLGGSSDGRGKGITAPNPAGQKLAVRRAWENAGVSPMAGDLMEGHGTSTRVGDVVEVESLTQGLAGAGLPPHSLPLGSVKSNFGHLKGAAGGAGVLKAALALKEKFLPPSLNCERSNPGIDFAHSPFYVNTTGQPWEKSAGDGVRRAGVSAFGFGGTNFHVVLEEYIPGRRNGHGSRAAVAQAGFGSGNGGSSGSPAAGAAAAGPGTAGGAAAELKKPLRGALVLGGADEAEIARRLRPIRDAGMSGHAPPPDAPLAADLRAEVRLAIDYGDATELADKASLALACLEANEPVRWKAARARGIHLGRGTAEKVAFLYTGQGSQYVNMLAALRAQEPIVAETFAEADRVMEPLLGAPLTSYIFVDPNDAAAVAAAEERLKQTEITQPAVLATDDTLTALLSAYGVCADFVMGHSLGEYGALVAANALSFGDALRAVSARGHAMAEVSFEDNGLMAAVFGPTEQVQQILSGVDGYVVIANINSRKECVIGGATAAVRSAVAAMEAAGLTARLLPVSHAFHTEIVSPASGPLAETLRKLGVKTPTMPIVANLTGDFYPADAGKDEIIDILAKQVGSPVQFVKGLQTLYDAGARVFVEVGPKRALAGFADEVLGERPEVFALFTNHPKLPDDVAFNQALCGLYAAGHGAGRVEATAVVTTPAFAPAPAPPPAPVSVPQPTAGYALPGGPAPLPPVAGAAPMSADRYTELGKLFVEFLDRSYQLYAGGGAAPAPPARIGITGVSMGLPGVEKMFDDANIERIFRGETLLESIPGELRDAMVAKRITRLVKGRDGEASFETIGDAEDVVKLAGRGHGFDLVDDFGFPADRLAALDRVTRISIAAGIDALRDAGIPLVLRYRTTTKGTTLPDRWMLPEALRDDTGVIFGSAFPALDSFAEIIGGYYEDQQRRARVAELASLLAQARAAGEPRTAAELDKRLAAAQAEVEAKAYTFDRRFLFRVLSMGHSQFAEYIGARGPNAQTNQACATGTAAVALAGDWIRAGRCKRVIIVTADDITTDTLLPWFGAGFLASGAAATDARVEDAALPFDRRRHGLLIGMGGAALVVETLDSARERGILPACEVLTTAVANSAFHGSRLDVSHIAEVMEGLIAQAEREWGLDRRGMARETVFVSHETYTPARGGSASAEVTALRRVFGADAEHIVVANTKGYTGHPMAVALEDALAVRMLETGLVPPVANFREVDPELGLLNLSRGGGYPIRYALRFGAGFGSQVALSLTRWIPPVSGQRAQLKTLGYQYRIADPAAWSAWLRRVSGSDTPELEVVGRTLRVHGAPAEVGHAPAAAPQATPRPTAPAPAPVAAPVVAPAPVAAAVPASAPPAPAPAAPAADPVRDMVLKIVSEKTGYPPDMLDLDLDLEADLGIDTVKQAETFAAIRAMYEIPRDDTVKLRDYPTLAHAVRFVYERRPDLKRPGATAAAPAAPAPAAPVASAPAPAAAPAPAPAAGDPVRDTVLAIVAGKTGYPPDMLDLDLDLEADLGIDTVKQAETFAAIRAAYDIPRDENVKLRDYPTLAHAIRFVYDRRPDLKAPAAVPIPAPAPAQVAAQPVAAPAAAPVAMPAAASAPVAAVPAVGALAGASEDGVVRTVLDIVAGKTGYPPDMLDLDLDLEADLGIDTVKQAEMFAAIRAAYDIPRDEAVKLRDYPTLKHAIEFVYAKRPELRAGGTPAPALAASADGGRAAAPPSGDGARPAAAPGASAAELQARLEAAAGVPRRVPVARLRPPLKLCKPTGVVLGEGSRVIVAADAGKVADALAKKLTKLGVAVLRIDDAPTAEQLTQRLELWKAEGPVQGVFWLPALEPTAEPETLSAEAWQQALHARVKLLYTTLRALPDLAGPKHFLGVATRLGGRHGYDPAGAVVPLGGAVVGFAKSFKRERPAVVVKAVDFEARADARTVAARLVDELLSDPGAVEVGYAAGERWTVALEEQAPPAEPGLALGKDTTFVVTGAAGSIVSAIVADLAAASAGTFYLLDLTPAPDPADRDIARLATDRDGLKRDLAERLKAQGERPTPALIERQLAALERSAAALAAIQAVQRAGGTAEYRSVNLLDGPAVGAIVREVVERHGGIDVLLHAAGMESSHLLPDKPPAEFDRVFDVKAVGWHNLVSALGPARLGAAVVFSSVAARFGNGGQTDYASANDLLCKLMSHLRSVRPETRGIAIDWTGWEGIGMASRGSIPMLLKQAGMELLPPEEGVAVVRRELTAGSFRGEVVIAKALGAMLAELDPSGGLDGERVPVAGAGPMIGRVVAMGVNAGLAIETPLDPTQQPFLFDHRIDEVPVLPGVMGLEGMAEAAALLAGDRRPVLLEDVRFLAPFKFHRSQPRTVELRAESLLEDESMVAACRLLGSRLLHGQTVPETTTHFTARVHLRSPDELSPPERAVPPADHELLTANAIYSVYFHGPAYRVLDSAWRSGDLFVGQFSATLPPNHVPADRPLLIAPRLIELAFQTAGLAELAQHGRMGLPARIARVELFCAAREDGGSFYALAAERPDEGYDVDVVDGSGRICLTLRGYGTMALPGSVDTAALEPLRAVVV